MKRYQGFWERKGEAAFLDIREPKASPAQGERGIVVILVAGTDLLLCRAVPF